MTNKFNLGGFDQIAKVNNAITKEEKKEKAIEAQKEASKTQEIDLSRLNLKEFSKDLKKQKSLALRDSTIVRLDKLAKIFNTSVSEIADKAIREVLELDL